MTSVSSGKLILRHHWSYSRGACTLMIVESCHVALVATDLDGTFWDATCRAHPQALLGLDEVSAMVPVIAATGRRASSAFERMRENGFTLPSVLFDGSLGLLTETGPVFYRQYFDADTYRRVLDVFLQLNLEPVVNIDDPKSFGVGQNPATHPQHVKDNAAHSRKIELEAVPSEWNVFSFSVCGGDHRLSVAFDALRNSNIGAVSLTPDIRYGGVSLSVRPVGATKLSGVAAYCEQEGIDISKMLVVADGMNDLELLSAASVACVPESACEEALELATHIIPNPSRGGWGKVSEIIREINVSG